MSSPGRVPDDIGVRSVVAVEVDPDASIPVLHEVTLFATDIDGTLLRSDGTISSFTRQAISDARTSGLPVLYVTGRPPRWLQPIIDATGHSGVAVGANGAVVLDLDRAELLAARHIDADVVHAMAAKLRKVLPGVSFAVELIDAKAEHAIELTYLGYEPAYDPPWKTMPAVSEGSLEDLVAISRPVKILARPPDGSGLDSDELLALVSHEFGDQVHLTHSGTTEPIVEIMAAGVHKGSGLQLAADYLGLSATGSVAVGDMPNDLTMLEWVETSYAVANAHERVRARAAHVVPGNNADGVGHLLNAILNR